MGYIDYGKLKCLMQEKGINSYTLKKNNQIGQKTYQTIMKGKSGVGSDISTRTIAQLCEILDCQPGDMLTYKKD